MAIKKQKELKSVLLIDDSDIDNFLHQKILENCGAENIHAFTNPLYAIQYLEQTEDIPQFIFLDLSFPIMDGFEFLEKLNQYKLTKHPIDVFVLSNSHNPDDIKKAEQKNAVFINKPLTAEKVMKLLEITEPEQKHK